MVKHTAPNVLHLSTAKVQPRYRGKYPYRVRSASSNRMNVVLASNDHNVLVMSLGEAIAIHPRAAHAFKWTGEDINYLAGLVADYRNAMQAGHTTGRVAAHVKQAINGATLDMGNGPNDEFLQKKELYMRYAVIEAYGAVAAKNMETPVESYRCARNNAWQVAKNDAAVSIDQLALHGIDWQGSVALTHNWKVRYTVEDPDGGQSYCADCQGEYATLFDNPCPGKLTTAETISSGVSDDEAIALIDDVLDGQKHETADLLLYAYRMLCAVRDGHLTGRDWLNGHKTMEVIQNRLVTEGKF